MPTYEYACKKCGEHLEAVQSFSDDPLTTCPKCSGELRKVFGAVGIVFKGSGFYKTDNRSNGSRSTVPTSDTPSSDSSSSSSASEASGSSDSSATKEPAKETAKPAPATPSSSGPSPSSSPAPASTK